MNWYMDSYPPPLRNGTVIKNQPRLDSVAMEKLTGRDWRVYRYIWDNEPVSRMEVVSEMSGDGIEITTETDRAPAVIDRLKTKGYVRQTLEDELITTDNAPLREHGLPPE